MALLHIHSAEDLIRGEYLEMPGLQLTFWQAQRLWNLSAERCERALSTLMATGFLVRTRDGCYTRPNSDWAKHGLARSPVLPKTLSR